MGFGVCFPSSGGEAKTCMHRVRIILPSIAIGGERPDIINRDILRRRGINGLNKDVGGITYAASQWCSQYWICELADHMVDIVRLEPPIAIWVWICVCDWIWVWWDLLGNA